MTYEFNTGYTYSYGQPALPNLAQAGYGYNLAAGGSSYGNYGAIGQPGTVSSYAAAAAKSVPTTAAHDGLGQAAAVAKGPGSSSVTGKGTLQRGVNLFELFAKHQPGRNFLST